MEISSHGVYPTAKAHRRSLQLFLEGSVIAVVCSAVFLFGATQPLVLAIEEFLIFFAFSLLFFMKIAKGEVFRKTPLFLPFMFFLFTILVQLFPLPNGFLEIISPHTLFIRDTLGVRGRFGTISLIPARTFYQFMRWTSVFLFYLLAVNVFHRKNISKLLISLFYLSVFEILYGLFLLFTGSPSLLWYSKPEYQNMITRVHGTYRNPDHLAGYLEMVIPVHLGQIFSKRRVTLFRSEERAQKFLGVFFIVLSVVALFFTASRAGITAFCIGVIYFYFSGKSKKESSTYTFYLKILVAVVFLYLLWLGVGPVIERFWELTKTIHRGRILVWKDTWSLVKDFPIFGTGFGTFKFVFQHYKSFPEQAIYDFAHNDYLQLLAEGGGISLLAFLWLVVRALKGLLKSPTPIARGATAGFLAILFHSFFDFNLHIPANAYVFAIILAIGWIGGEEIHDRYPLPYSSRP